MLTLLPALPVAAQQDGRSSLRLQLRLNKSRYLLGEPVVATVTLTNTGSGVARGPWLAYDNRFYVGVEDSSGKGVSLFGLRAESVDPDGGKAILAPGESVITAFDLVVGDPIQVMGNFLRAEDQFDTEDGAVKRSALVPGRYTFYVIQDIPREDVRERRVRFRATARFEVVKPGPATEDALALFRVRPVRSVEAAVKMKKALQAEQGRVSDEQARERLQRLRAEQDGRARARALDAYGQLVRRYPTTPYAPYAQYHLGRIHQTEGNFAAAVTAYEALLARHPGFPLRADALYFLAESYARSGQNAKAAPLVVLLKRDYPNHLIAPTIPWRGAASRLETLEQEMKADKPEQPVAAK